MSLRTRPNIPTWRISCWEEVAGNPKLVEQFKKLLVRLKVNHEPVSYRALIYGPSRSGKTSLIRHFMRCLACEQLDRRTLNPCNSCTCCCGRIHPELNGMDVSEAYARFRRCGEQLQFAVRSCATMSNLADLRSTIDFVSHHGHGTCTVYLDEAHLLNPAMQNYLLSIDDRPGLWLFSTAHPERLEPMLRNRLVLHKTKIATVEILCEWLAERCKAWGIPYDMEAIKLVASKSNYVCGIALKAIDDAANQDEGLTLEQAEDWIPDIETA